MAADSPVTKRLFDVGLAAVGLLLSWPLWLLIAACIKLEDRGRVFFVDNRLGARGRLFRLWKFRTMRAHEKSGTARRQTTAGDPRVTRVGHILRATALDELPQLWNILKGDMSFVGPRALLPREIEASGAGMALSAETIAGYEQRQAVRPGLTGIAQVYAPRNLTRRQKFRYDRLYVRRMSLWLDLRLILLSFLVTFLGRWEQVGEKLPRGLARARL